jgi:hypothetical protein
MKRNANPESRIPGHRITHRAFGLGLLKGDTQMKSITCIFLTVLAFSAMSAAEELPDAPSRMTTSSSHFVVRAAIPVVAPRPTEVKVIDRKFLSLVAISTGSTFADSYTTLFARQNWLAGKTGVCNAEGQSPYLYGTHPTVARAYAVASVKSVTAALAAYYLRKHGHNRLWSLPLLVNTATSLQGVGQNLAVCN